jgi:antitoxin (DNA-binding transcriptional repressor) of toxin-antitoxin stability system
MTKMVGIAEFKAKCERLISQMEKDGEPIALTRRGKVVGVLKPPSKARPKLEGAFGMLKNDAYRFDWDPSEPAADPSDWDALR